MSVVCGGKRGPFSAMTVSMSVFDELEPDEMRRARTRSNPFETIRGAFFLNRAAMKMANMDKVFDFMFTRPKDENDEEVLGPDDLLYFADVCAGPGGFSEYVLWRRSWKAKGFGFTLKGENDFRLQDFYAGPCETFEPHYGGHFVCKLFDLFTPFSVGLVYLMYKSFRKISIHKPNTSRPANSERYIICKWKRKDCDSIADYMYHINELLWKYGTTTDQDIVEIVPLEIMTSDDNFYNYIIQSNNSLGERQVVNLVKIAAFCRDTNLTEPQQAEMKRQCLSYWEIPDKLRTAPPRVAPDAKCDEILKKSKSGTSGLVFKKHGGGRRISDKMIANVQAAYERNPHKSLRRASWELQIPKSTLQRIVPKRLKLYTYQVQLMQRLEPDDKPKQVEFANTMLDRLGTDPDFMSKIFFLDEATFHVQDWPPRSPDLTLLNFFLWSYVKDKVYATPVRDLRERIVEAIESIPKDVLQRAWQEIVHHLDIVTMTAGAHVEI
ncbi:hypothetical protein ANN_06500 [Periplaneta americana]|uniref:Cap-specific mRNA (nucleoside-2'-O-)-methyltransferase 1 n=1 Tax=Periplaneta americana TaxID=6978 RepID=A0ABQ8TDP6_PERAM|nr:hypothetical protein ANN_06500 [Periplaneta americana]